MKSGTEWVVFDVETSGLRDPIYIVEIAAQRMTGWEPTGTPFRILIDHNTAIEPSAQAIHGYTREFLSEHGESPIKAHEAFARYVSHRPLCSYNLAFDWNRALERECERLGCELPGERGFCLLMLSRRLFPEAPSHKLADVLQTFGLKQPTPHRAQDDTLLTAKLFSAHCRPRLEAIQATAWGGVCDLSCATPIATIHERLAQSNAIRRSVAPLPDTNSYKELRGILEGITADRVINDQEFLYLNKWLLAIPSFQHSSAAPLFEAVEKILADGIISPKELDHLVELSDQLLNRK